MKYFPVILFLVMFLSIAGATAFTLTEDFSSGTLDSAKWVNRSVCTDTTLIITTSFANFSGGSCGSVQRNSGVSFTSRQGINITENGTLTFNFQQLNNVNGAYQYFGLKPIGYAGCIGGIAIESTPTEFQITNGKGCTAHHDIPIDTAYHAVKINVFKTATDTLFDVYWDGDLVYQVTQANTLINLYANFSVSSNTGNFSYIVDNIYFTNNMSESHELNLPLGSFCGHDSSVCATGYCEYTYCSLKGANLACSSGAECITGVCSFGKCTKPDAWTAIDASKTQQFGDSSLSNNFVSLFLMCGVAIGILIMGMIGGNVLGALVLAGGAFFALGIFFTLAGWLSAFILIGAFMAVVILAILGVILLGGS